jgi:hypothetical protein
MTSKQQQHREQPEPCSVPEACILMRGVPVDIAGESTGFSGCILEAKDQLQMFTEPSPENRPHVLARVTKPAEDRAFGDGKLLRDLVGAVPLEVIPDEHLPSLRRQLAERVDHNLAPLCIDRLPSGAGIVCHAMDLSLGRDLLIPATSATSIVADNMNSDRANPAPHVLGGIRLATKPPADRMLMRQPLKRRAENPQADILRQILLIARGYLKSAEEADDERRDGPVQGIQICIARGPMQEGRGCRWLHPL